MATTGDATRATRSAAEAADSSSQPVLRIWRSEHVDLFRWVLTFGRGADDVFHGNARSLEQAMRDIEHCRRLREGTAGEAAA